MPDAWMAQHSKKFAAMMAHFHEHFTIGDVVTACGQLIQEAAISDPEHVHRCRGWLFYQAGYDNKPVEAVALLVLVELANELQARAVKGT